MAFSLCSDLYFVQPVLSGQLAISWGWALNTGSTVCCGKLSQTANEFLEHHNFHSCGKADGKAFSSPKPTLKIGPSDEISNRHTYLEQWNRFFNAECVAKLFRWNRLGMTFKSIHILQLFQLRETIKHSWSQLLDFVVLKEPAIYFNKYVA